MGNGVRVAPLTRANAHAEGSRSHYLDPFGSVFATFQGSPPLAHFAFVPNGLLLWLSFEFLKLPGSELPGILCPWSGSYPVGGGVGKAQLLSLEQFEVQLSLQSPPSGSG